MNLYEIYFIMIFTIVLDVNFINVYFCFNIVSIPPKINISIFMIYLKGKSLMLIFDVKTTRFTSGYYFCKNEIILLFFFLI